MNNNTEQNGNYFNVVYEDDMNKIKIGDKFWCFNGNRRRYINGSNSPDFNSYFVEAIIIGETSRSWLIKSDLIKFKVPKKEPFKFLKSDYGFSYQILTDEMKEDKIWANYHKYKLTRFIETLDNTKLRHIAKMVNYDENTN